MIDKDDVRAAALQALADLGIADVAAILEHMPERMGATYAHLRADLQRLEGKGLISRVSGYALTQQGREVLGAIMTIKGAFPGPGAKVKANGAAEAVDE